MSPSQWAMLSLLLQVTQAPGCTEPFCSMPPVTPISAHQAPADKPVGSQGSGPGASEEVRSKSSSQAGPCAPWTGWARGCTEGMVALGPGCAPVTAALWLQPGWGQGQSPPA